MILAAPPKTDNAALSTSTKTTDYTNTGAAIVHSFTSPIEDRAMMMSKLMQERRKDTRIPLTRPVKIRCAESGKYHGGTTRNISARGALVQINGGSHWFIGQTVQVGVAWTSGQSVLTAVNMATGKVVRRPSLDHGDQVAIEFQQMQELAVCA